MIRRPLAVLALSFALLAAARADDNPLARAKAGEWLVQKNVVAGKRESAQVPRRGRTSDTQSCAARHPSTKVGIMTNEVGSPLNGKTRTLNSALPPMGDK